MVSGVLVKSGEKIQAREMLHKTVVQAVLIYWRKSLVITEWHIRLNEPRPYILVFNIVEI